ncbi:MAG: tRNA pseudouridine(55) synthase TruB [Bacteroidetes bacterium]|jgi:tRNA pseudouridine55 synthase|nr:MAG: pseudouridine synthase [Cryomorphaceae bacterium BACL29 MAG-121220-bin8]MDA0757655.1 tRNA pseudouridine(55) synthase TruB [Bacteroidota bacterium]MDA1018763.1 tRNA pseudouridine(55) synthase TruB [Bacteroidota bacterium]|tara:strand:+ start:9434 stop:10132 length:699 start_codon:yes stop_codon:yes gene_type:complete
MDYNKNSFIEGKMLLINKPVGWTSFQIVNKVRWLIKTQYDLKKIKVGHAGTLDPLAEGLLILCTGKWTKKIDQFQGQDKTYSGIFHLGATTPSFDLETEVNSTYPIEHINKDLLTESTNKFIGDQYQIPPIYSAIKQNGKKLYEYARKGETVELKKRKVNISEFKITKINLPKIHFTITCSKGTYIRSLANDYGLELKSGAYLNKLKREAIGDFNLKNAVSIEQFEEIIRKN